MGTGAFITITILGVLVILFAAAWLSEKKDRKFFSRMYTKALFRIADMQENKQSDPLRKD